MDYCRQCGKHLDENNNYCGFCGKPKTESTIGTCTIGKTCPYCQFPLKQESKAVQCKSCKTPHHQECWNENDGCTTFGCVEKNYYIADAYRNERNNNQPKLVFYADGIKLSGTSQPLVCSAEELSIVSLFNMVKVGSAGLYYSVPIGIDDFETIEVIGGYQMAVTQTTYKLWYSVRQWALENNYCFQNSGREGSQVICHELSLLILVRSAPSSRI